MERMIEHREHPRQPARLDAVIEFYPARMSAGGRWWENFAARTLDVGEGGVRVATTDRLAAGGRIRMILPPRAEGEGTIDVEGDIVWVREPVLPWLGTYRAGIAFRPALQTGIAPLLERAEPEHSKVAAR